MYRSVNKIAKGAQALLLRQTAGKVSATTTTKPMQTKVAEFVWYSKKLTKADQLTKASESNK